MRVTIDGEQYEVDKVQTYGYLKMLEIGSMGYYVAEDSETAGEAAREYWEDMMNDDPTEFAAIIGTERLVQWGMRQQDNYGFSSAEDFLCAVEGVPEEEFASYDGMERVVTDTDEELTDELGFTPTVAYRHN